MQLFGTPFSACAPASACPPIPPPSPCLAFDVCVSSGAGRGVGACPQLEGELAAVNSCKAKCPGGDCLPCTQDPQWCANLKGLKDGCDSFLRTMGASDGGYDQGLATSLAMYCP
jgi:hypothetical protein